MTKRANADDPDEQLTTDSIHIYLLITTTTKQQQQQSDTD